MKRFLKWTGLLLGSLLILALGTAFYLNHASKARFCKKYDINPRPVAIPTDSLSIAAGKKWSEIWCANCHGADLGGSRFFESPDLGSICAPNLTTGGVGKTYSDIDWLRSIRHGVNKNGRGLLIMPAKDFQYMSDEHIGQLIAYLKTTAPLDKTWPSPQTTVLCNILAQLGAFGDDISAEIIDHKSPGYYAPPRSVSPEYGGYLVKVTGCRTCHGSQLNGGKDPNPEAPMGPNLTPGGELAQWGADGFVKTIKTGITPTGKEINANFMPVKSVAIFDDDQLKAIYAYLMSIPKMETAKLK